MATRLTDLLEQEKVAVLARWATKVEGVLTPESTPPGQLIDSLPKFLEDVIATLAHADANGDEGARTSLASSARVHGAQRFHVGFSLDAVVREYDFLRECILDVMEERGISCGVGEFRALSHCLGQGVADAVAEYTRQRDEQLERATAEQFAFIAHELRNPLNAALVAAGLLHKRMTDADEARLLASMQRSLAVVASLLERVLLENRLKAVSQGLTLQLVRVSITELIADVGTDVEVQAHEKGIAIRTEVAASEVEVDTRLFKSAVTNLVFNAVKFTREGGTVTVRASTPQDRLVVEVEDECGGLPPTALDRLFLPHVQAHSNRVGFGLGLAIVKQAIEAHCGTVQARDLAPKGCVFMIDVPAFHQH
jgi:signal transduction histidine kinase